MAGAFQSGFAMGQGAYAQVLAHAERERQRKREEERWAIQKEGLQLGLDQARSEAARQRELATVLAGVRDYSQGIDRQATNAALDADFEAADRAALRGEPLPPSVGGSAAANEAALTVRRAIDPASSGYRLGLNRRLMDAALLSRDVNAFRALEGETRGLQQQGFLDQAARMPADEVMRLAGSLNTQASQLPVLFTGRTANGYQFLTTDAAGQPARTVELSEPQARQLVAAKLMAEAGLGAESMALIGAVNKDLAEVIARINTQTGHLASASNEATAKEHTFGFNQASEQRAAQRLMQEGEDRAEARKRSEAAVALYRQAHPQASAVELDAVRRGILGAPNLQEMQRGDAAVQYYQQKNPQATPAELEAVRRGLIGIGLEATKDQPAEVRLAAAFVRAGLATDMAEGLRMATTTKAESPERVRAEIFGKALAANMGNAQRAQEATEAAMRYLYPDMAARPSGTARLQNVTPEDITATARKYGITEEEVRRRLGL